MSANAERNPGQSAAQRCLQVLSVGVFVIGLLFFAWSAVNLIDRIPNGEPNGGPDEPMHLSVSRYIAKYGHWPPWNSNELVRYKNGASYASGSSFGYWIEAILQSVTGRARLSGLLLFFLYLAVTAFAFWKNRLVGLIGLAAILPQVLFVFCYFNSDAWTAFVALLLGLAIIRFRADPTRSTNIGFLFAAAGLCISCRFHLWAIGFVGLLYALLPQLGLLLRTNRRSLFCGLAVGVIVALWWPVTSFLAHDGDFFGFPSGLREIDEFGDPLAEAMNRPWSETDVMDYAQLVAKSLYGVWGWASIVLSRSYYAAALFLGVPLVILLWSRQPRLIPFFVLLLGFNFVLMLSYATTYDYQWQGRHMFPSTFLILGMMLGNTNLKDRLAELNLENRWILTCWLALFLSLNGFAVRNLMHQTALEEAQATQPTPNEPATDAEKETER